VGNQGSQRRKTRSSEEDNIIYTQYLRRVL